MCKTNKTDALEASVLFVIDYYYIYVKWCTIERRDKKRLTAILQSRNGAWLEVSLSVC